MPSLGKLAALAVVALSLAGPALAQSNDGQDRRVRIHNQTEFTIREFYASNENVTTWQEDILGRDVLPARESVLINIDDGTGACVYDFRAVFEDDLEVTKFRINVCRETDFYFTP